MCFAQVAPRIKLHNIFLPYVLGRWTFLNGFLTKCCEKTVRRAKFSRVVRINYKNVFTMCILVGG